MNLNFKRAAMSTAIVAAAVCLPGMSSAATINVFVGNFDIAFDGSSGELTDFNRPAGGNQDPNESRTVSSVEFEVDGATEELLMNPPDALFADLRVTGLGSELTTGSLIQGAGGSGDPTAFGFDFFTSAAGGVDIQLGIDDISYTLIPTGIPGINFFNFFAEGQVLSQVLPAGIPAILPDVLVSYTATEVMIFSGPNGGVETLVASGQLTVTGTLVPEPSTACLVALMTAGGAAVGLRRRWG